jgi:hypothetical protein
MAGGGSSKVLILQVILSKSNIFCPKGLSLLWNGGVMFCIPMHEVIMSPKIVYSKSFD